MLIAAAAPPIIIIIITLNRKITKLVASFILMYGEKDRCMPVRFKYVYFDSLRVQWCKCKCKIKRSNNKTCVVCKKKEKKRRTWFYQCTHILPLYLCVHALLYVRNNVQNATKQQFIAFVQCYLHGWEKSRVAVLALDMLLLIFLCSILYRFLVFLLLYSSFGKMTRRWCTNETWMVYSV